MSCVALGTRPTTFNAKLNTTHDNTTCDRRYGTRQCDATLDTYHVNSWYRRGSATTRHSYVQLSCVAPHCRASYRMWLRVSCVAIKERHTTFNLALTGFRIVSTCHLSVVLITNALILPSEYHRCGFWILYRVRMLED